MGRSDRVLCWTWWLGCVHRVQCWTGVLLFTQDAVLDRYLGVYRGCRVGKGVWVLKQVAVLDRMSGYLHMMQHLIRCLGAHSGCGVG